jgi:hypothetical protein
MLCACVVCFDESRQRASRVRASQPQFVASSGKIDRVTFRRLGASFNWINFDASGTLLAKRICQEQT